MRQPVLGEAPGSTLLCMRRRVIDDRFELVERLGGGGMGLVWRAWDVALHREVALKEVRPPDPDMDERDPEAARELRARVLREARALARLNHPHVVTIHHIVDNGDSGYPWLVMELVSGGSLQERLEHGPMTPQETARLGREILSALRAAHAVGIQHRDVKPANVLLRPDGRSVLTDFGIAAVRESTSLTATGSFIGSPEYIAPERINGHEGDPASDLWSLGMLLYVAVEGRHPLRRATTLATLAAVLNQDVPPPQRAGALGPVLGHVLTRDLAARPDGETLDRMLASVTDTPASMPAPPGWAPGPPLAQPPNSGPPFQQSPTGPGFPQPHMGPPMGSQPGMGPQPNMGQQPNMGPYSAMGPQVGTGPQYPPLNTSPPLPRSVTGATRRRTRRSAAPAMVAVSAAVVVVVGVLVWTFLPALNGDADDDPQALNFATPTSSATKSTKKSTSKPTEAAADPGNLLTPAGMRTMISKLKPVMGGTKVFRMTVYPEYASIEGLVKGEKDIYDRFTYRDGVAERQGPGGTANDAAVDLAKFNWDALPALFRKADKDLRIRKPTTHYMIVDPAFAYVGGVRESMMIYVGDEYRTAYLVADVNGKVIKTNPA
ncbi:protein kinase [Nonomuraea sp. NPDC049269]|uniref:protein kinase domain-containing protein n=1 Tax=Nonomuraea sp. NPDC049269 TaxID=3364349 RepID=UPI00370F9E48